MVGARNAGLTPIWYKGAMDFEQEDHDDAGAHDSVHVVMDQRRHELRGGIDAIGPFDSLRVKLANTDYTHTEFEGDAVGTVFHNRHREARPSELAEMSRKTSSSAPSRP